MKRLNTLSFCSAMLFVTGCGGSVGSPPVAPPFGQPQAIQHIVIMVQENRSFDNLFAGFPGADAPMDGPCKPATWCKGSQIVKLKPIPLKSGAVNFGKDIDHSHNGFEIECDANGSGACAMDGFDLINYGESGQQGPAHTYPYAYVDREETASYWKLAKQYALADKMFSTDTASSFIAHQQLVAGTAVLNDHESATDQPNNTPWGCDAPRYAKSPQITFTPVIDTNGHVNPTGPFPCFSSYNTIADLLDAKQVSYNYYVDAMFGGRYYDFSGAVWNGFDPIKKISCPTTRVNGSNVIFCNRGPDWKHVTIPNTKIFTDLTKGTLPQLSYVIPTIYDSDHPAAGCNGGPRWVTQVVNAIGKSQYWSSTAIILLWDDWGGLYDNVPPPQVNYHSLGMRVPMIVISPFAKPHHISHTEYDFGSILKFIEQNFGLGSLGTTDVSANSMSDIFDFNQKPNKFTAAHVPHADACAKSTANPASTAQIIEHDGGVPE
jgi:phospholipase C